MRRGSWAMTVDCRKRAAVAEQVAIFARRIEELETLVQQSADEIEKLKEHVFPIDWDAFLAKRRAG